MMHEDQIKKYPIDSDFWYKKAEKQTLETLPDFIREVREAFPAYDEQSNYNGKDWHGSNEQSLGYKNGMIAGVLCMVAVKEAISSRYGWSYNQAGVVRTVMYEIFFSQMYVDFERF